MSSHAYGLQGYMLTFIVNGYVRSNYKAARHWSHYLTDLMEEPLQLSISSPPPPPTTPPPGIPRIPVKEEATLIASNLQNYSGTAHPSPSPQNIEILAKR